MCGDHISSIISNKLAKGSPPHVRGPHSSHVKASTMVGITPACAGTTNLHLAPLEYERDHPRMCGDHRSKTHWLAFMKGSPPHVRGPPAKDIYAVGYLDHPRMCGAHHMTHAQGGNVGGITPACAGTTRKLPKFLTAERDHPRMCGDHTASFSIE